MNGTSSIADNLKKATFGIADVTPLFVIVVVTPTIRKRHYFITIDNNIIKQKDKVG